MKVNPFPGWGRKLAYCIAFSNDGATDVTRRYVRQPTQYALPRTKLSEETLLWCMLEIRKLRREGLDKSVQQKLRHEDEREERELQSYVAQAITHDMLRAMPSSRPLRTEGSKTAADQQQQQQAVQQHNDTSFTSNQHFPRPEGQ